MIFFQILNIFGSTQSCAALVRGVGGALSGCLVVFWARGHARKTPPIIIFPKKKGENRKKRLKKSKYSESEKKSDGNFELRVACGGGEALPPRAQAPPFAAHPLPKPIRGSIIFFRWARGSLAAVRPECFIRRTENYLLNCNSQGNQLNTTKCQLYCIEFRLQQAEGTPKCSK